MRTTRALGAAAVLAATALVAPGGASAASPTTYSGQFDGQVTYVGCEAPDNYASGPWSVTMHGTSAKGDFTIYFNDETVPHVAYTFPGMKQAPGNTEDNWSVYGKTMAGLLTVAVHGSTMTYTIEPYHYGDLSCDKAIFPGTVERD